MEKGRVEVVYPAEAEAIIAGQVRYRPPPPPRPPSIQSLLKDAHRYQKRLEENPGLTRAELAREAGIDPSSLTRLLNLLNLAPEIQRHILQMPPSTRCRLSERRLRPLADSDDPAFQVAGFRRLLDHDQQAAGAAALPLSAPPVAFPLVNTT